MRKPVGSYLYTGLICLWAAVAGAADQFIDGRRFDPADTGCAGFPRLPLESMPGSCVGLVASARDRDRAGRGLIMPRTLLRPTGSEALIVVDLGGWTPGKGRVWRVTPRAATDKLELLLDRLSLPHGLRTGPDGKIYIGEMHRIFRFDPAHPTADIEVVISDLPGNTDGPGGVNRHPITQFIFDRQWNLYVSAGAPSDACEPDVGRLCSETGNGAQLRRYAYDAAGNRWNPDYTVYARGLRNTMAMVFHAGGTFMLADNGRDFPEIERPHEEINVLRPGAHYGWPYCYDFTAVSPEWRDIARCRQGASIIAGEAGVYQTPYILLPPHSAPLDMLYYQGPAFPQLQGRLIVGLHGYRETGHRIIAFAVDADGLPQLLADPRTAVYYVDDPRSIGGSTGATAVRPYRPDAGLLRAAQHSEIISGWSASQGLRPMGSPVGLMIDDAGLIWVVEDHPHGKAIIVIAPAA